MSALRILALSYLACASAFIMAAMLRAHPELGRQLGRVVVDHVLPPAVPRQRQDELLRDGPSYRLTITPLQPGEERLLPRKPAAPLPPRAVTGSDDRLTQPEYSASATISILPDMSPESAPVPPEPRMIRPPEPRLASPELPRVAAPEFDIARNAPPLPPEAPAAAGSRAAAAQQRLRASLTPEMLRHFELFLYVSKASRGPLAQHMYVFRKTANNQLRLLHDWPASTGREREEFNVRGRRSFTATPAGYYQLDPQRMYRRYHSWSWDQPMPNAMFFNWEREGERTGLAIHAATGNDIAKLGSRASAGCVHLSPENAADLYALIRADYRGTVPRFAYNRATQTMTNEGGFMRDGEGRLKMADGYKVLVDIEDFGGERLASLN